MKKIETRDGLESWIKKCNLPMKPKDLVELQDEFAHTDVKVMHDLFKDLGDKKPFLWSVQKVMGMDIFFEYVRIYVRKVVDTEIEYYNQKMVERERKIYKREEIFEDCKKPIHKKIWELREKVKSQDRQIHNLTRQLKSQIEGNWEIRKQIEKQDQKNNDLAVLRNFAHLVSRMGEKV